MAARYAVTTGNWTGAIWAATSGGAAGSAAVPTSADDVTINKNVTVTIDDTTAVANTVTLSNGTTSTDVGAILTCTTAANWKLTIQNGLSGTATSNPSNTATYASSVNLDMSAAPTYTGDVVLNAANSTTDGTGIFKLYGNYQLKGKARKRHTTINSALTANTTTSVVVADATGWAVGDVLVFATTGAFNATPYTDIVTIATITPGGGTTATVTWTDGAGTGGAVLYGHDSGCPVGNFTSNLIFKPATDYYRAAVSIMADTNQQSIDSYIDNVQFFKMRYGGQSPFNSQVSRSTRHKSLTNCAFYEWSSGYAIQLQYLVGSMVRQWNVFYSAQATAGILTTTDNSFVYNYGPDEDYAVFRGIAGIYLSAPGQDQKRHKISGLNLFSTDEGAIRAAVPIVVEDCDIWSNYQPGIRCRTGTVEADRCSFDSKVFTNAASTQGQLSVLGTGNIIATDCELPTSETFPGIATNQNVYIKVINRDGDASVQEFYQYQSTTVPAIQRTTTSGEFQNAASGMEFTFNSSVAQPYETSILAKAGTALKLLLYVKKGATYKSGGGGTYTEPTATLSGLGITPVVATATSASDGAWELLTVDLASGSAPTSDGLLTLTLSAQSSTASAQCWFSGIPLAPFMSRCRHYGYVVDETNPARVVDTAISASYATASAYTGIAITWGATSSISTGSDQTFQKLVDYTASQMINNVGSALPITWAGVAGSPAIFAQGAIDISGDTLNGSGSLSMGSNTLTATDYTYTGGTFSQAASVPSFSGGTLNIGAAGTYTYAQAAAMILSMTPTAPGTYALGATTFTGQVDLRNTSGSHAITVELPTGTSYTTANNTGATITVTLPVVTADISITGMANTGGANNRLQIINSTVLAASDWQAATAYAAGDVVLRTSGIGSENTAGLYMRCTSGGTSHATTEPTWDTTVGNTTTDNSVTWTTYAVLYYDADPAGTSLTDTYIDGEEFVAGETIEIRFAEEDPGVTFKTYSTSVVATADGFSALVNETADDVYATYALSGAAYEATFSPNYAANYIVLDANTDFSGKAAYAYYCYLLTTSSGMYRFWGGLTGIDAGNIRNNVGTISLYFDESAGFVKQTDDVRIFRSDNTRPAIDPTTGGSGIEINWRVPVNVVSIATASVLSPSESAQLMSLPSATSIAAAVWASVVSGSTTAVQMMRGFAAILLGKVSGAGTGAETFRDIADTKDVVTVTVDSSGNRSAVTRNLT